jgi:inorganic pyrophosphatase
MEKGWQGSKVEFNGWGDAEAAKKEIMDAVSRYSQQV